MVIGGGAHSGSQRPARCQVVSECAAIVTRREDREMGSRETCKAGCQRGPARRRLRNPGAPAIAMPEARPVTTMNSMVDLPGSARRAPRLPAWPSTSSASESRGACHRDARSASSNYHELNSSSSNDHPIRPARLPEAAKQGAFDRRQRPPATVVHGDCVPHRSAIFIEQRPSNQAGTAARSGETRCL